jgi:hypothetical protein
MKRGVMRDQLLAVPARIHPCTVISKPAPEHSTGRLSSKRLGIRSRSIAPNM